MTHCILSVVSTPWLKSFLCFQSSDRLWRIKQIFLWCKTFWESGNWYLVFRYRVKYRFIQAGFTLKLTKTDKAENLWLLKEYSPQYRSIKCNEMSVWYKKNEKKNKINKQKMMKMKSLWVIHTSSLHPSSLNSDVIRRDLRWHRGKRRPSHCLNNFTPTGVEKCFYVMLLCSNQSRNNTVRT